MGWGEGKVGAEMRRAGRLTPPWLGGDGTVTGHCLPCLSAKLSAVNVCASARALALGLTFGTQVVSPH